MLYEILRKALGSPIPKPENYPHIADSINFINSDPVLKKTWWGGVNIEYLESIERRIGSKLPLAFKEYCLVFGNFEDQMFGRYGEFDLLQDVLEYDDDDVEEIARVSKFFETLDQLYPQYNDIPAFCFSSHEGYVHYWFYLTGEENPTCFFTIELDEIQEQGAFSTALLKGLRQYSELKASLRR